MAAGKWSRIYRVVTSSERKFSLCVFFIVYENNFFILEKCNGECRKTILTYESEKTQKKLQKSLSVKIDLQKSDPRTEMT